MEVSPQCRAYTRDLERENQYSRYAPAPGGDVVVNDWFNSK